MDTHKNAPLTPKGREAMVRGVIEGGLSKAAAARQFNTTAKTVAKWVGRFRAEGVDGLRDRSSRPLSLPSQTHGREEAKEGKEKAREVIRAKAAVRVWGSIRVRDGMPNGFDRRASNARRHFISARPIMVCDPALRQRP
jgi:transposase-like protein